MFGTLRQPEYTGENRCWPCTFVNTTIAVAIGGVVSAGVVTADVAGAAAALGAGAVVLAVSLAVIYLRGYLVPGTPALTKRYMPVSVRRLFGKEPLPGGLSAAPDDDQADVDVEVLLTEIRAVEPCDERDDLCLTAGFRDDWNDEIAGVREAGVDAGTLVETLGLSVEDAAIEEFDDARVLATDDAVVGKWPSEAALVADSAAATVLAQRYDEWEAFSPQVKGQVLNGLRLFLEDCPTGDGGVEFGEETVESCCGSQDVVAVTCEESGDRLFEQPVPE